MPIAQNCLSPVCHRQMLVFDSADQNQRCGALAGPGDRTIVQYAGSTADLEHPTLTYLLLICPFASFAERIAGACWFKPATRQPEDPDPRCSAEPTVDQEREGEYPWQCQNIKYRAREAAKADTLELNLPTISACPQCKQCSCRTTLVSTVVVTTACRRITARTENGPDTLFAPLVFHSYSPATEEEYAKPFREVFLAGRTPGHHRGRSLLRAAGESPPGYAR